MRPFDHLGFPCLIAAAAVFGAALPPVAWAADPTPDPAEPPVMQRASVVSLGAIAATSVGLNLRLAHDH